TLRRFVHKELAWRERPSTVRVDDPPLGEEAQIDFGHVGWITTDDGVRRKLWVLVVTLTVSRYMHVWPTLVQTTEALCDGLHAATWCREVAGARIHGTTRRVPREAYEAEEKAHMLPAPSARFDVPTWTRAKLHPDHHIQVARALYSVPTAYLGQRLDVRVDR